jgi:translation initiation factor IF-3
VDGETGQQLGIMRTQDALNLARNRGLDLVEVAATAEPPVCRIVDYGKFRYQLAKQEKERKAVAARTASKVKELKLRVNIDEHDYFIKMRRSEGFLCEGDKLRVQLMFRGRELAHQELGYDLMVRVIQDLKQVAVVEMEPKKMGRNINMTLAPLPANKRKPKFQREDDEDEEDDHDDDFSDVDEDAPHAEDNDLDDEEEEEGDEGEDAKK